MNKEKLSAVDINSLQIKASIQEKLDKALLTYKEELRKEVELLRPEKCSCSTKEHECYHWGVNETVDEVLSILNK